MGLIRILLDDYINELKNKKVIKCFGESLGETNQRITEDKANYEIYREQTENKDTIEEIKSKDNKKEDAFLTRWKNMINQGSWIKILK